MINRSVVRIPLLPTVFKEYFDMFFKVVRKNISQKINRNINSCRMRVPVPSCSRSMISGQNLIGAYSADMKNNYINLVDDCCLLQITNRGDVYKDLTLILLDSYIT